MGVEDRGDFLLKNMARIVGSNVLQYNGTYSTLSTATLKSGNLLPSSTDAYSQIPPKVILDDKVTIKNSRRIRQKAPSVTGSCLNTLF